MTFMQNLSSAEQDDIVEETLNNLIRETLREDAHELHRAIKLNYFELVFPEETVTSPNSASRAAVLAKTTSNCACIRCGCKVAATRYASHLSKCMGLGRNSSRRATRRIAEQQRLEDFNDTEDDWRSDLANGMTGLSEDASSVHLPFSSSSSSLAGPSSSSRSRRQLDQASCGGSGDGDSPPLFEDDDSEAEIDWTHDVRST